MKVAKFKDGTVVKSTKNEKLGRIMLISSTLSIGNGFGNTSKRVGFVTLDHDVIKALGLDRDGADFNAALAKANANACKIRVIESLEPAYDGHAPKINPRTQEIIVDADGSPVYYSTEVVELVSGLNDILASKAGQSANAEAQSIEDGMSVGE